MGLFVGFGRNQTAGPSVERSMKRLLVLLVLAVAAAACGSEDSPTSLEPSSPDRAPIVANANTSGLAAGFNDVGFDILRRQDFDANTVLSPVSIGHAVLMARGAADDATGSAIDSALALDDGLAPHDAWNAIDQAIADGVATNTAFDDTPTPVISIADRIWPASTASPSQEWVDLLASRHGADVSTIDTTQPEESRAEINRWVSDNTEGLIPELLPAGFINPDTQLVLTDAIYFKAQWQTIFAKYGEVTQDFTSLDGTTEPTTFMRELEGRGARGIGDGYAAANLPYLGDNFSMLVVIPDEGRFDEVRTNLSTEFLSEVDATITPGPYELLLPKWEDTSNIDLLPWLIDIGAAPGAYPGIGPGVFLSGGVHAADIAVDEWGTVAAAATGLGFDESGPPEPEFTIAADKPFLYLIRHDATGLVLFVGQVTNPNA